MDFLIKGTNRVIINLIVFGLIGYHREILRIKKTSKKNLSKKKFDSGWRTTKRIPKRRMYYLARLSKKTQTNVQYLLLLLSGWTLKRYDFIVTRLRRNLEICTFWLFWLERQSNILIHHWKGIFTRETCFCWLWEQVGKDNPAGVSSPGQVGKGDCRMPISSVMSILHY